MHILKGKSCSYIYAHAHFRKHSWFIPRSPWPSPIQDNRSLIDSWQTAETRMPARYPIVVSGDTCLCTDFTVSATAKSASHPVGVKNVFIQLLVRLGTWKESVSSWLKLGIIFPTEKACGPTPTKPRSWFYHPPSNPPRSHSPGTRPLVFELLHFLEPPTPTTSCYKYVRSLLERENQESTKEPRHSLTDRARKS